MGEFLIDNRYEVRGRIGSGGMADVFLAHDEVMDRDVALKTLKSRYADNEEFVERFRREARSAAALTNPYIVRIFDRGETEDKLYYIVMEYLSGGTLKDRINNQGALSPRATTEMALQIAEALQVAHERGIVHRDVKPQNILVADSGHVKVTDFGIARAAEATTISHLGDILGSAKYMSPEQAAGERVSTASDLYSLGVVLYEMLTGHLPFDVATPAVVPDKHADGAPPRPKEVNPGVPEALDALVMRLLATDPSDRPKSAAEIIEELERIRPGLPSATSSGDRNETPTAVPGPPTSSTQPQPAPGAGTGPRRRLLAILAVSATLVALLGGFGWLMLQNSGEAGGVGASGGVSSEEPGGTTTQRPKGPKEVKVPDVQSLSERDAKARLAEAGFRSEVRHREGSEEEAGKVLDQSVAGGKRTDKGSKILLTVGDEPKQTKVPDLVGLAYPEAEDKLKDSGFLLGGVEEATSDTVPAGVIMKQEPRAGSELDPESYIRLTTSVGPPDQNDTNED